MASITNLNRNHRKDIVIILFKSLIIKWMKASGLGTAPRKLIEEIRELKSLDVLLTVRDKTIRLGIVLIIESVYKDTFLLLLFPIVDLKTFSVTELFFHSLVQSPALAASFKWSQFPS